MREKSYIAIGLKSSYASVECKQHGLDPMMTTCSLPMKVEQKNDWSRCRTEEL